MCGRFVVAEAGGELVSILRIDAMNDQLPPPSCNVAPTSTAAIVLDSIKTDPPSRRLEPARWGLIPPWAKDAHVGVRAFNARSEELEEKPTFRAAFQQRRAVIPATGYYEWKTNATRKQPYYIAPAGGEPLFFAGLYEWWKDPTGSAGPHGSWVLSFTILTQQAEGKLAKIHPRQPVAIEHEFADSWLDPTEEEPREMLDALVHRSSELSETYTLTPVSDRVGNVRNNDPSLIDAHPA